MDLASPVGHELWVMAYGILGYVYIRRGQRLAVCTRFTEIAQC